MFTESNKKQASQVSRVCARCCHGCTPLAGLFSALPTDSSVSFSFSRSLFTDSCHSFLCRDDPSNSSSCTSITVSGFLLLVSGAVQSVCPPLWCGRGPIVQFPELSFGLTWELGHRRTSVTWGMPCPAPRPWMRMRARGPRVKSPCQHRQGSGRLGGGDATLGSSGTEIPL